MLRALKGAGRFFPFHASQPWLQRSASPACALLRGYSCSFLFLFLPPSLSLSVPYSSVHPLPFCPLLCPTSLTLGTFFPSSRHISFSHTLSGHSSASFPFSLSLRCCFYVIPSFLPPFPLSCGSGWSLPSSRSPSPLSSSLPLTFARVSSPAISHALCPELLRFRNLRISPRQPRPPRKVQAARSHAQRASGEGSAAPADGASPRAASRALLSTCEELAGGSIAPQRLQPGTDFGGKQRKRLSLVGLRVEHDAGGAAGGQSEAGALRGSSSSPSSHPSSLPQRISHLVALTPGPGGGSLPASSTWGPFPAGCAPLAPAGVRPPRRHHRQCLCLW